MKIHQMEDNGTRWVLGLVAGIACYLFTACVIALPLVYAISSSRHWRFTIEPVLVLIFVVAGAAVPGGLISGAMDKTPSRNISSAVIIGASLPLFFWTTMLWDGSDFQLLSIAASVPAVWAGRAYSTRQKAIRPNDVEPREPHEAHIIGGGAFLLAGFLVAISLMYAAFFHHQGRRPPSNESAAVSNLRTINTAEVTYLSGSGGTYGTIYDLVSAGLLEDRFGDTVSGYRFVITLSNNRTNYEATAMPSSKQTGKYGYYSHPDCVIRYSTDPLWSPEDRAGGPVE